MKHIENHNYLICAICQLDWNVTERQTRKHGPYVCPLCRKILKAQEGRYRVNDKTGT